MEADPQAFTFRQRHLHAGFPCGMLFAQTHGQNADRRGRKAHKRKPGGDHQRRRTDGQNMPGQPGAGLR